ncbi:MAG TPA: MarR family winged helix-turn-helix transcriptional regulator [Fimbriimonadaceae bacterium]|nr:MarR family winged helix-turn-helix transcriptional regulator [Fimbriimonadaceae bacterium]
MTAREFARLYPVAFFACHGGEDRHPADLSKRELEVLAHLDLEEGVRPTDLARHLGVSGATVSVALERLKLQGLVERFEDSADGRSSPVKLTALGSRVSSDSGPLNLDKVRGLLDQMTQEEKDLVCRALRVIRQAAERMPK